MKYLIVGLGNIGSEYAKTRHNIGFEVLNTLALEEGGEWKTSVLAENCEVKYKGRTLVLIKPSTYMNRSGKAVNYWLQKQRITNHSRLLVVVDDLNLDFGVLRLRGKGSAGGHNGLKDIEQYLGGRYPRLRMGIGSDFGRGQQVDYVLGKWTAEQRDQLPELCRRAADAIRSFAFAGLQNSMNTYNR